MGKIKLPVNPIILTTMILVRTGKHRKPLVYLKTTHIWILVDPVSHILVETLYAGLTKGFTDIFMCVDGLCILKVTEV